MSKIIECVLFYKILSSLRIYSIPLRCCRRCWPRWKRDMTAAAPDG